MIVELCKRANADLRLSLISPIFTEQMLRKKNDVVHLHILLFQLDVKWTNAHVHIFLYADISHFNSDWIRVLALKVFLKHSLLVQTHLHSCA